MPLRVIAALLLSLLAAAPARADGPLLSVPADALAKSLVCTGDLASGRTPVLLVPGTGEDPDFYDWNYKPALAKLGLPYCTVTLPGHSTDDIQVAAEFVVGAIRTMHARAGRKIAVLGHSQGGMVPRWALKWWPDTRAMVDDLVGLASSNHGTTGARAVCSQQCTAATWQQRDDSKFIAALNAGAETYAPISYTSVYTRFDEVVTPNQDAATGSTALRTGDGRIANVAVQDLCPADPTEHLDLGSRDPVGYALFVDAITHDGPADPARIDPAVCTQFAQPGVDPATYAADSSAAYAKVLAQFSTGSPYLTAEPPLKCYAGGPCPAGSAPATSSAPRRTKLFVTASPQRVRRGVRTVRVLVRRTTGKRLVAVRGARVWLAGARGTTNRRGVAVLRKRFVDRGPRRVLATRRGFIAGQAIVLVR